jgi:putative FmdB family regulatory protein
MPLYEYACSDCTEVFTVLQTLHVKPGETFCPKCNTTDVQKRFSPFVSKTQDGMEPSGGGTHSCPPTGCGCG